MAASLVTALCLASAATGQPDDHFQGTGPAQVPACQPGSVDVLLTVDRVGGEWFATVEPWLSVGSCPAVEMFLLSSGAAGILYRLDGDWENGFQGTAATSSFMGLTEIDPYGDGEDIFAQGCTLPNYVYCWYAFVTDVHLL